MAEGTTEYEINLALAASKDECVPIYAALPLFCASGCVVRHVSMEHLFAFPHS